jgi:hypothetical protein
MKFANHVAVLMLLCFLSNIDCQAQTGHLDSVKVEFAGFNTESFTDVSCEAFDYTFKDTKKIKVFRDEQDLAEFKQLTKDFKQTSKQSLDVRGAITYYYSKKSDKYCFTVFGYFYSIGKFYYNKALLIYLSDRIYADHPKYLDTLKQPWQ